MGSLEMNAAEQAQCEIEIPQCPFGLGHVIVTPGSGKLIEGVRIETSDVFSDDRGYFLELARMGTGMVERFPAGSTQVSAALNYPGIVKAFHYHRQQTDYWVAVAGVLQVALVDLRAGSPGLGSKNTMYIGTHRPWRVLIPPGVGHGYKAIGTTPSVLVYVTDRFYNPADEGRIPYNDKRINYDWELQHK